MKKLYRIIRSGFIYLIFGLYMLYSLLLAAKLFFILKIYGQEAADRYAVKKGHGWGKFVIGLAGLNIKVIGKENLPQDTFLIVADHQSFLDIPVLLGIIDRPLGFVSKKEVEKVPILSFWMKRLHCVFMDRENIREAIKAINEGIENLKKGYSMVIFPEGTRSKGKDIKEFKKGSLKLGTKANVPIVPITIEGTYKVWEEDHGLLKRADIIIQVSEPVNISSLSKEELNNLSETIRQTIVDNRNKIKAL